MYAHTVCMTQRFGPAILERGERKGGRRRARSQRCAGTRRAPHASRTCDPAEETERGCGGGLVTDRPRERGRPRVALDPEVGRVRGCGAPSGQEEDAQEACKKCTVAPVSNPWIRRTRRGGAPSQESSTTIMDVNAPERRKSMTSLWMRVRFNVVHHVSD